MRTLPDTRLFRISRVVNTESWNSFRKVLALGAGTLAFARVRRLRSKLHPVSVVNRDVHRVN